MKKLLLLFLAGGLFLFSYARPVSAQETYTLPTPRLAANLIAVMKAEAKIFPGVEVEASQFLPGTTTPNNVTEVTFKFSKPESEGLGILTPWLVALLPFDQNLVVHDFVVRQRFSADYESHHFKEDPRVHDRLKEFLKAVYARLDQPEGP